jgi:hypothetical protein
MDPTPQYDPLRSDLPKKGEESQSGKEIFLHLARLKHLRINTPVTGLTDIYLSPFIG